MRTHILILSLCALLLIAGCAPQAPQQPAQQRPTVSDTPTAPSGNEEASPEEQDIPDAPVNPEIAALLQKTSQVKSFRFDAVRLPSKGAFATYWVRDGKAKVKLITPIQMNGWSADYIFVDYEKKVANAYCLELTQCKGDNRVGPADFGTYGIWLPMDWRDAIERATPGRAVTFDMRPVTVVKWEADGSYFEAYLDNYYGFPLRIAKASDAEMTMITAGGEYRAMAFNTIKAEDVTPPW